MKKQLLMSAICALTISLLGVALMRAQGEGENAQGGHGNVWSRTFSTIRPTLSWAA
jgi:hypothetical protein